MVFLNAVSTRKRECTGNRIGAGVGTGSLARDRLALVGPPAAGVHELLVHGCHGKHGSVSAAPSNYSLQRISTRHSKFGIVFVRSRRVETAELCR